VPQRVALIVNPTSGKGLGRVVGADTRRALVAAGHDVVDATRSTYADARDAGRKAVLEGVDTVVVVGGDGLVHLGVNLCAGTPTRLAVVAAGTGNDFARNLCLPLRDAETAVRLLDEGGTRVIDLGRVARAPDGASSVPGGERWFGGVLGAGFDAVVTARAARMTWPRGQLRYNLAILRELPVFRPIPYVVDLDGERLETRAMLVAVANTASFGGGMRVCPDADPTDGLFDVMVLHELSIPAFLRIFPTVYSGAHVSHPAVEIRRARRVHLEAEGIESQADGETFARLPLDLETVPGALRVVVPAGGRP
jgi:diacylglycerol kinase (ATP)